MTHTETSTATAVPGATEDAIIGQASVLPVALCFRRRVWNRLPWLTACWRRPSWPLGSRC